MNWNEIMEALTPVSRGYPVAAAEALMADPAMVDQTVAELARMVRQPAELEESMFHLHAMLLLAQRRDTRAFRPLLEMAALPSEQLEYVLGDHLTESLSRCIASVCDDESLVRNFAEHREYDIWARMAMVDALAVRVLEGDSAAEPLIEWLTALGERTVAWLETHSEDKGLVDDEALLMDCIAGALVSVGGLPEVESIRRWWDAGWLDPMYADLDWYAREAAMPWSERLKRVRYRSGYIRDAIGEMSGWYCFSDAYHDEEANGDDPVDWHPPGLRHDAELEGTFVRTGPKVGRNDPCPCGSGKKFKKCCGAYE